MGRFSRRRPAPRPAGGVTTIVDMPLNSIPPTTSVDALHQKLAAADGECFVDVGFWGGVVAGNADHLVPMDEAGVLGFKGFLVTSGVDEFPAVSVDEMEAAMSVLVEAGDCCSSCTPKTRRSSTGRRIRTVRRTPTSSRRGRARPRAPRSPRSSSEPPSRACAHTSCISAGRRRPRHASPARNATRVRLTVETCPHYLTHSPRMSRREHRPSSAARRFGRRKPRSAVGRGLADGVHQPDRLRPLARTPAHEVPGRRQLRGGVGRHRLGAARTAARVDRGARARHRARQGRRVDVAGAVASA